MSGGNNTKMGGTLNEALLRRNTDLQASVTQQLIMHQQLQQQSQLLKEQEIDATFITGQSIDAFCNTKQNDLTLAQ